MRTASQRGSPGRGSADHDARRTAVAVSLVTLISVTNLAVLVGAYLQTPGGLVFTGNLGYGEDGAQHELWARQMWQHGRFPNLLTAEPTAKGWFFSPLEWFEGGLRALTGLPYPVVTALVGLVCTPVFAWGLVRLARRAGVRWPCSAAVVAAFAGGFGPLLQWAHDLGAPGVSAPLVHAAVSASGDATPAAAGIGVYQLLVVVVLLGLVAGVDGDRRGFPAAGIAFAVLASIYPFYTPVLGVTALASLLLWSRMLGRGPTRRGLAWVLVPPAVPALYYLVLPRIDAEFARFQSLNHLPLLSPKVLTAGLALGLVAIACTPLLLRSTPARQLLGVLTVAVLVALFVPQYPWRTHLFHFAPFLVLGAAAGVTIFLARRRSPIVQRAAVLVGAVLVGLAVVATPFYVVRAAASVSEHRHPEYVTRGEADAIEWLADRADGSVVLAPSGTGPWVAAWGGARTLVGHYFWTHEYDRRRRAVDAVYRGRDPRRLMRRFRVRWVLVDAARRPGWARGVPAAARFHDTLVLDAARLRAGGEPRA